MKNDAIFRLNFDCGRQGTLSGIFVASKESVDELIKSGKDVYFGEALGKHSKIFGPIEERDIEMITDNEEAVRVFVDLNLETGYNPFNYIEDDQD